MHHTRSYYTCILIVGCIYWILLFASTCEETLLGLEHWLRVYIWRVTCLYNWAFNYNRHSKVNAACHVEMQGRDLWFWLKCGILDFLFSNCAFKISFSENFIECLFLNVGFMPNERRFPLCLIFYRTDKGLLIYLV